MVGVNRHPDAIDVVGGIGRVAQGGDQFAVGLNLSGNDDGIPAAWFLIRVGELQGVDVFGAETGEGLGDISTPSVNVWDQLRAEGLTFFRLVAADLRLGGREPGAWGLSVEPSCHVPSTWVPIDAGCSPR